MNPTSEQRRAIELFSTGESLKINAFAGTGKTTTLVYLAKSTRRAGVYLAFNKSIARDAAGKFPSSVSCKTTHSLAFGATPSVFRNQPGMMTAKINPNAAAAILDLGDFSLGSDFSLSARTRAALVLDTVRRFEHSDSTSIRQTFVPHWGKVAALSKPNLDQLAEDIARHANVLWSKMINPHDRTPLGHDGYLKLWSLSNPRIPTDFILLDEAQDTNPAMLAVLKQQRAQTIYVGDRYQQIYEWRGAVNIMEKVATTHSSALTKSFRFGPSIAQAASALLSRLGEKNQIEGNMDIASQLGCAEPNAILCRTNAGVIDHVIQALEAGAAPHVIGGTNDALRLLDGVRSLQNGQPTDVPEFFGFRSWGEVVQFAESDEGQQLRSFVRLVGRYRENRLRDFLNQVEKNEEDASVLVSTAHKAKGREWDKVAVVDDFTVFHQENDGSESLDPSELRLLYVALTRARHAVQIPQPLATRFGIHQNFQLLRFSPRTRRPTPGYVIAKTARQKGGPAATATANRTVRAELPRFDRKNRVIFFLLLALAAAAIVIFYLVKSQSTRHSVLNNSTNINLVSGSLRGSNANTAEKITQGQASTEATALYEAGINFEKAGYFDEAIKAFQQALSYRPDYFEAHHELGYALYHLHNYKDSVDASKRAIALKPNDGNSHNNLGLAYASLGRWDDARKAFERALEISPDDYRARLRLGNVLKKLGNQDSAEQAYKEAVRLRPDYAAAHYELGLLCVENDDPDCANLEYEKLKQIDQKLAQRLFQAMSK